MKLTPVILASILAAAGSIQGRQVPYEGTQQGMNEAADQRLKTAEAEMSKVLDSLLKEAIGKPGSVAKLNKAQSAWSAYRDAQIAAMWPSDDPDLYGSVHPMCVASLKTRLTEARSAELREMLTFIDGESCNSHWPE